MTTKPDTEFILIPMERKILIQGKYLGKPFTFETHKGHKEFMDVFYAPLTEETPTNAHSFHKQMMWLYDHCISLHHLPRLPEPKPFKYPHPTDEIIDMLETMSLHLKVAIHDLKENKEIVG